MILGTAPDGLPKPAPGSVPALLCAGLLGLVAVGWLIAEVTADRLLRAEAERLAAGAVAEWLQGAPELNAVLEGRAPAADSLVAAAHRPVRRLTLFDANGRPLAGSTDAEAGAAQRLRARHVALGGRPLTVLSDTDTRVDGQATAEVYMPLAENGSGRGALLVAADLANAPALYRRALALALVAMTASVLLACLPAAAMHLRNSCARTAKQMERRDAALLEEARQQAERLAASDALSGLLNRRGVAEAFEDRRRLLGERDLMLTLVLVDVDDLAAINDSDGHEAGDTVLRRLGTLLGAAVRQEDIAGRLGGDEFLLIVTTPRFEPHGARLARRLLSRIAEDPELQQFGVPVTVSIGLTQVWKAQTDFAEALRQADLALAAARREGRGRQVVYQSSMGIRHDRRRNLRSKLNRALRNGDIVPAYQPVVALGDRRIDGFEALARWRHGDGSLLEAGRFRDIFENPHQATLVSERILALAIADGGRLRRQGREFGRLAVNVTEAQVADPGFAERLLDSALAEGLAAAELSLELTEDILLSQRESAIRRSLQHLSSAGVLIAFDDFGSGFASLSHLRRFPIDRIKLDFSCLGDLGTESEARTIAAAIFGMARGLEIETVAVGVRTAELDRGLKELGCDYAQGFRYARPVPFDQIGPLLEQGIAA